MISYIHRSRLEPHPDNPRQDLGDLTELAASIRKSGILQNLTVVPSPGNPDKYRIIIGHRRFAASELAGIDELPCAIEEMSMADQIATMLAENMQRNELTIADQVYGVQTMMDLGEDIKAISEKTGLSATTVRRRAKLADLNSEKLIAAEKRGATLLDLMKITEIKDPAARESIMDALGTANFNSCLQAARDAEKAAALIEAAKSRIEPWARLVSSQEWVSDRRPFNRVRDINLASKDADFSPAEKKAGDIEIICVVPARGSILTIYRVTGEAPQQDEAAARRAEEQRRREARQAACDAVQDRMFILRKYFLQYDFAGKPEDASAVLDFARNVLLNSGYSNMNADKHKVYDEIVGNNPNPLQAAAAAAWCFLEVGYQKLNYASWEGRHKECKELDMVYNFLQTAGYQMSDEEIAWQNGSHACFFDENEVGTQ